MSGYGGIPLGGPGNPITAMSGGKHTAPTPGTAVAFDTSEKGVPCTGVEVQALETNTAQVAVGGSDVKEAIASRKGIVLQPGESRVFYITNLNQLFMDVGVANEGCGYLVMK